jgi:ubiquitin C-terminal hydrolase
MASESQLRTSHIHEEGDSEREDQDEMEETSGQEAEETWQDQPVREMVEPEENWRVIGLSNVGNTCFTNAILQVFSYVPWKTI